MIVDAWDHRISDIARACNLFINESDYPIDYSDENTQYTLWSMFSDIDTALLVNYTDDVFNGFAIVQRTNEFHLQYFGYLSKFYILPERRKTKAAFLLMQEAVSWFDTKCILSFATATAGIGNDEGFTKLCKKFDYTPTQTGMLIRKQHGKI